MPPQVLMGKSISRKEFYLFIAREGAVTATGKVVTGLKQSGIPVAHDAKIQGRK